MLYGLELTMFGSSLGQMFLMTGLHEEVESKWFWGCWRTADFRSAMLGYHLSSFCNFCNLGLSKIIIIQSNLSEIKEYDGGVPVVGVTGLLLEQLSSLKNC